MKTLSAFLPAVLLLAFACTDVSPGVRMNEAAALLEKGDTLGAVTAYSKIIASDSSFEPAYTSLGDICRDKDDTLASLGYYGKAFYSGGKNTGEAYGPAGHR